jgi:hypothetical protein
VTPGRRRRLPRALQHPLERRRLGAHQRAPLVEEASPKVTSGRGVCWCTGRRLAWCVAGELSGRVSGLGGEVRLCGLGLCLSCGGFGLVVGSVGANGPVIVFAGQGCSGCSAGGISGFVWGGGGSRRGGPGGWPRARWPSPVLCAHSLPSAACRAILTAAHHPPGRAQAGAACHRPDHRPADQSGRRWHPVFVGGQLGVLLSPDGSARASATRLDAAHLCQDLPPVVFGSTSASARVPPFSCRGG